MTAESFTPRLRECQGAIARVGYAYDLEESLFATSAAQGAMLWLLRHQADVLSGHGLRETRALHVALEAH